MPLHLVPILVGVLITTTSVITLAALWGKILSWAQESLFPFIKKMVPSLEGHVKRAFVLLDKVFSPLHQQVFEAWKKVREFLLTMIQEFERRTDNEYICKITQFLRVKLEKTEKPKFKKVVEERSVEFSELPEEIRKDLILKDGARLDVTKARDQEMEMVQKMAMENT
ncbi:MAG: hypothetical protein D6732_24805 [Methanobacteriota archaeon]|nr:MAG: hypothetical protein D6732_24805 [Euryarchaeota archaeon]